MLTHWSYVFLALKPLIWWSNVELEAITITTILPCPILNQVTASHLKIDYLVNFITSTNDNLGSDVNVNNFNKNVNDFTQITDILSGFPNEFTHCYGIIELVNIGSGHGLLWLVTEPLSEPTLTYHQWVLKNSPQETSITKMSMKMTSLKLQPHFPGFNELTNHSLGEAEIFWEN